MPKAARKAKVKREASEPLEDDLGTSRSRSRLAAPAPARPARPAKTTKPREPTKPKKEEEEKIDIKPTVKHEDDKPQPALPRPAPVRAPAPSAPPAPLAPPAPSADPRDGHDAWTGDRAAAAAAAWHAPGPAGDSLRHVAGIFRPGDSGFFFSGVCVASGEFVGVGATFGGGRLTAQLRFMSMRRGGGARGLVEVEEGGSAGLGGDWEGKEV